MDMSNHLHINDLPPGLTFGDSVAIDSEAMGLRPHRDRLCLVQMSRGDGDCHLVHFPPPGDYAAPNLKTILEDPGVLKIFHFARFDVAIIEHYLGVTCAPVYCTKIASKLVRTFTDRHGLKDLCRDFLGVDLSKQQQSSDWGATELTPEQQSYAASDVLYLHDIKNMMDELLAREGRMKLAQACFDFLPYRAKLDLAGWDEVDIFHH